MLASEHAAGHVQSVLALRTFAGFASLGPGELAVLAEILRPRFFPAGTTILSPGTPVKAFHMIVDGRVKILKNGRLLREFGSKDVVGGLAAFTRDPDGAHVVAIDDTLTFECDRDDMEEVFEDNFTIQLAVLRGLARQAIELRKQLGVRAGFAEYDENLVEPKVGELWLVERMSFLKKTLPFGDAHVEAIAALAQSATELRFEAGQRLWREGDESGFTITLLNGTVDCVSSEAHKFEFQPLSVLGAIDSMAAIPRWYEAVCRTPIIALRGETENLIDFMEDHPSLATEMSRLNARMISEMLERVAVIRDSQIPPTLESAEP